MLSAPTRMAPAASSRSIKAASRVAGGASRLIFDPASVGRPRDVEQILDRERHAGERTERLAGRAGVIDRLARAASARCFGDRGEGIEQRIALADAEQRRFDDARGARAAGRHRGGDVGRTAPHQCVGRRLKHGIPAPARYRRAVGNSSTSAARSQHQAEIEFHARRARQDRSSGRAPARPRSESPR